jgi:hypothetical protein
MQNTSKTNIKDISLSDLLNPASFESWIKKHINIYNDKEIPVNHLISFIEYIEKQVEAPEFEHDRGAWFDTLTNLKDAVSKNDKFKKRHSEDTE